MNTSRLRHILVLIAIAFAGLAATARDANATHFRYGTITWQVVNPATPNVVKIRFDSAWRRTFFSPLPVVGGPTVTGLGNIAITNNVGNVLVANPAIVLTTTAINTTDDW